MMLDYSVIVGPGPDSPGDPDHDPKAATIKADSPRSAAIEAAEQVDILLGQSVVIRVCLKGHPPKTIHDFYVTKTKRLATLGRPGV